MSMPTAEEANDWLRPLVRDDDQQEQSINSDGEVPWAQKGDLDWADFLSILRRYCAYRGWEIITDVPDSHSLAIFAHDGQADEAEGMQGHLPFWEDLDPYPF